MTQSCMLVLTKQGRFSSNDFVIFLLNYNTSHTISCQVFRLTSLGLSDTLAYTTSQNKTTICYLKLVQNQLALLPVNLSCEYTQSVMKSLIRWLPTNRADVSDDIVM